MQPLISIVIPTHNNADTISFAVESILKQSLQPYEIIVIDDGSTDQTSEILKRFENQIHYSYQPNQERSIARNQGIELAKGEWVAFLDADDWWLPNKLQRQVDLLQLNPDLEMVFSQAYVVDETGKRLALTGTYGNANNHQEFYCQLLAGNLIPSPTPLIRKELLQKIGGFDVSLCQGEDWDCWLRIAQTNKVGFIPEPLACYRTTGGVNLLKRMAKRGGVDATLHIINKAVQRGGCPCETINLAVTLAQFEGALLEVGCGEIEKARIQLRNLQAQYPESFSKNRDILIEKACQLAAQVCLGETSGETGELFLKSFLEALPAEINPSFSQKELFSKLYATRFFQAVVIRNWHQTFQSLGLMLYCDPGWFRNRGVWSVLLNSLFTRQFAISCYI